MHASKRPHTEYLALVTFSSRCFIGLLLSAKPDSALPEALMFLLLILNDNSNVKHALQKEKR